MCIVQACFQWISLDLTRCKIWTWFYAPQSTYNLPPKNQPIAAFPELPVRWLAHWHLVHWSYWLLNLFTAFFGVTSAMQTQTIYDMWKRRLVIDILKFDCQRRKLACKTHRFLPSSPGQKTSGNLSPNLCCLLDICFLLGKLQPFDQTLRLVSLLPPLMVKV